MTENNYDTNQTRVIVNRNPNYPSIVNPYFLTPKGREEFEAWAKSDECTRIIRENMKMAETLYKILDRDCRLSPLEMLEEITI